MNFLLFQFFIKAFKVLDLIKIYLNNNIKIFFYYNKILIIYIIFYFFK